MTASARQNTGAFAELRITLIDLDLLEQIYDVVLGRSSWDDVMGRLRTALCAEHAMLIAYGQGPGAIGTHCRSGPDEGAVRAYVEHFAAIDPYVEAMRTGALPPGKVMFGDEVVPGKALLASEYYHDWFRPNGLRYTVGGYVRSRDGLQSPVGHAEVGSRRTLFAGRGPRGPELFQSHPARLGDPGRDALPGLRTGFRPDRRPLPTDARGGPIAGAPGGDRLPQEVRPAGCSAPTTPCAPSSARSFRRPRPRSQIQLMRLIHRAPAD